MKNKNHPFEAAARCFLIPALAALLLSLGGFVSDLSAQGYGTTAGSNAKQEAPDLNKQQKERGNEAGPAALSSIMILFKLDSRMSGPTYGGERWVSPPTFSFAQGGNQLTVEAKAQGLDAKGRPVDISPTWIPADPEMVTITTGQRNEVKITVKRVGQTSLEVVSQGVSKKMSVKATATQGGKALQVEITQ
jgi:hypothetical protein